MQNDVVQAATGIECVTETNEKFLYRNILLLGNDIAMLQQKSEYFNDSRCCKHVTVQQGVRIKYGKKVLLHGTKVHYAD